MPNRSLADISQDRWIKACRGLGLTIEYRQGKGSHITVHNRSGKHFTIVYHTHKRMNEVIFKALLGLGFTEEQIWKRL